MPSPPDLLFVTGFGSFENVVRNASAELCTELGRDPGVRGTVLPVTFRGSAEAFDEALAEVAARPLGAILSMGVHRGPSFRLERRARATLLSGRPDTAGDDAVVVSGAMGGGTSDLETEFDLEDLAAALRACGADDVELSDDAGGYVCERVYRHALWRASERGVPAVFLHVPPLDLRPLDQQLPIVRGLLERLRSLVP